jgi:hypothetical protein
MKFNMTGSEKCDLFNTGDCLIEMITWAGLTTINRDGRIDCTINRDDHMGRIDCTINRDDHMGRIDCTINRDDHMGRIDCTINRDDHMGRIDCTIKLSLSREAIFSLQNRWRN